MADKFNPRGAPVPSTGYYDGWELTHRPSMFPFLAEYTNAQGETSGGMAMPSMVEEPINALSRLLNTPSGTMPAPNDPQNQKDALLGLMSLYGGNALGGMARGVAGRAAGHALEMETASPVAYSNAIEGAMRNPNMLRMMDDIDYAGLNRRALDEYGVGYEGLTSSQEAAMRGWSDPALLDLFSDTGKPNPVGSAVAGKADDIDLEALLAETANWKPKHDPVDLARARGATGEQAANAARMGFSPEVWYRGLRKPYNENWADDGFNYQMFTDSPSDASSYAMGDTPALGPPGANILPAHVRLGNGLEINAGGSNFNAVPTEGLPPDIRGRLGGVASIDQIANVLKAAGYDSLTVRNVFDKFGEQRKGDPGSVHVALRPENIRSVNAAFDPANIGKIGLLLSDTGLPSLMGSAVASQTPNLPFTY